MSDGKMEWEMDKQFGVESGVIQALYWTVMVEKELSHKMKLSIYCSVYVLTLTFEHEFCVVTERTGLQIQASEMRFLRRDGA